MKKMTLFFERVIFFISILMLGYICGIGFYPFVKDNFYNLPAILFVVFATLSICIIIKNILKRRKKGHKRRRIKKERAIWLILLAFFLGVMISQLSDILYYEIITVKNVANFLFIAISFTVLCNLEAGNKDIVENNEKKDNVDE